MNTQHSFSHGLLVSIAPESFSALHLSDNEEVDGFDWGASESGSSVQVVLSFLKSLACGVARID